MYRKKFIIYRIELQYIDFWSHFSILLFFSFFTIKILAFIQKSVDQLSPGRIKSPETLIPTPDKSKQLPSSTKYQNPGQITPQESADPEQGLFYKIAHFRIGLQ